MAYKCSGSQYEKEYYSYTECSGNFRSKICLKIQIFVYLFFNTHHKAIVLTIISNFLNILLYLQNYTMPVLTFRSRYLALRELYFRVKDELERQILELRRVNRQWAVENGDLAIGWQNDERQWERERKALQDENARLREQLRETNLQRIYFENKLKEYEEKEQKTSGL